MQIDSSDVKEYGDKILDMKGLVEVHFCCERLLDDYGSLRSWKSFALTSRVYAYNNPNSIDQSISHHKVCVSLVCHMKVRVSFQTFLNEIF